jgi:hypothetical protein
MEQKQQSEQQPVVEQTQTEKQEARQSRRLQIVVLEERVAPNAIWGE